MTNPADRRPDQAPPSSPSFAGRAVLVTGASRGIGLATGADLIIDGGTRVRGATAKPSGGSRDGMADNLRGAAS